MQRQAHTRLSLFNFGSSPSGGAAKIPSSKNDRDNQAINAVKAAIDKPRNPAFPLLECEFPALEAQNKLGDGSLRSALEAEDANIAFVNKLIKGLAPAPFLGPKVSLLVNSAASNSFLAKLQKVSGAKVYSLKDGVPTDVSSEDVCIFLTPSTKGDYKSATLLAESNTAKAVVLVNCFAKVSLGKQPKHNTTSTHNIMCIHYILYYERTKLIRMHLIYFSIFGTTVVGSKKYSRISNNGLLLQATDLQLTNCWLLDSFVSQFVDST